MSSAPERDREQERMVGSQDETGARKVLVRRRTRAGGSGSDRAPTVKVGLDDDTRRWIELALQNIEFGEVVIAVHDGKVVRVDTKRRERVTNPAAED